MSKGKKKYSFLLVESISAAANEFQAVWDEIKDAFPFEIIWTHASSFTDALGLIEASDGVITNAFITQQTNDDDTAPLGRLIATKALQHYKPVVWVTDEDLNIEGLGLEEHDWGLRVGMELFHGCSSGVSNIPWKATIYGLIALTIGLDRKLYYISGGQILGDYDESISGNSVELSLHYSVKAFFNEDRLALLMEEAGVRRKDSLVATGSAEGERTGLLWSK